jgi:hypothetical protein
LKRASATSSSSGKPGISQQQQAACGSNNNNNGNGNRRSCCICLEAYVAGERVRTLPCLHQFHVDCVDKWMARKAQCPVCKFSAFG